MLCMRVKWTLEKETIQVDKTWKGVELENNGTEQLEKEYDEHRRKR